VWIRNKDTKGHSPEALDQELPYQILSCGVLGGVILLKENHKFTIIAGTWFFTCAKDAIIQTRCDEKFDSCPYCGEDVE